MNKKFISIRIKAASFILSTLIFIGVSLFFTTNYFLKKIIDKNQFTIYNSQVDDIIDRLKTKNQKLKKTGMVEAYLDAFQKSAVKDLRKKFYNKKPLVAYPIIVRDDRIIIMHPKLPYGSDKLTNSKFLLDLMKIGEGEAYYTYHGIKKWIVIKEFNDWGWRVAYSVPLNVKYADLANFRNKFFLIFILILLIALLIFRFLSGKVLTPLKHLSDATEAMIKGKDVNLDFSTNNDEIGLLAERFIEMQESIKEQFDLINAQKAETVRIKNYLANIVNSMPSILIGVDKEGKITQWNLEAQNKTGLTPEMSIGKPIKEILPRLSSKFDEIQKAIEERKPHFESNIPYKKDKKTVYEDLGIYPLIANGVEGAVIRIDDVTKEYLLEQQVNQSRKMEAIGQLAGGIAHDFNNMLAGIMGAAQLLKFANKSLDEKGRKLVEMILDATKRAAELTAKLLAFGRKEKLEFSSVDVHNILENTIALFRRTIDKKIKISFIKNAENSIVFGNNSALQNSFLNLGINASHAMENGGELTFRTRNIFLNENYCFVSPFDIEEGNYLEIEVRDTGCGISPENLHKIFDPFFTTKEEGKGTGLGLSSVYGTIQDHHGAITVYSEVGSGTVFHILIPSSQSVIKNDEDKEFICTGSGTILLVDDENIIRQTSKYMLEEIGFNVILAENGFEAVEIYKEKFKEISLVIMDMIMPKMKGNEAFYKMKEINRDCKIIITSGFTKDESLSELREDGLAGFIQKPFNIYELGRILKTVLE